MPDRKYFYSELYLRDIPDKDYSHAQKVFQELKLKNLGDYHDLYIKSDTLLLPDVFKNFRKKCIEIYELDAAHSLSAPGLAWQACLIKTCAKLALLTNIVMLLMVEQAIHSYAKANNKYMKNSDKNMESSYFMYLDTNNLYR